MVEKIHGWQYGNMVHSKNQKYKKEIEEKWMERGGGVEWRKN